MTPQYIMRKSLCRPAHCFSSFVPNKGYVGDSTHPGYAEARNRAAISEIENLGFANEYAEPGYDDPPKGILMTNWNVFPRGLDDILERYGFAIEWSDEWTTCSECGKAVRISPDGWSWKPSYVEYETELLCLECAEEG